MINREKVIKGLECCDGYCDDETGCPYFDELEPFDCQEQLRADAIALLKAQEPVVHGHWIENEDCYNDSYYTCSACGCDWTTIDGTPEQNNMKYCPECGAKMDGERREADADTP